MSALKEEIKKLSTEDKDAIMKAFDKEESFRLNLRSDLILGVNLEDKSGIEIIEEHGCWLFGRMANG